MNKITKDGKTAVLISSDYGAGWSTWNDDKFRDILCMDAEIVQAVLDGDKDKAARIAEDKCDGYVYIGGARDLEVIWVPIGEAFEIDEYDGYESLNIVGDNSYLVA